MDKIKVSDSLNYHDSTECDDDDPPTLYLNDTDNDFKPIKNPIITENDYSVCLGFDSDILLKYSDIADSMQSDMSKPYQRRGCYNTCNSYVGSNEDILPYKNDVMKCGFEIIQVKVKDKPSLYARIAAQSRGDIFYIFSKGNFDPSSPQWNPPLMSSLEYLNEYVIEWESQQICTGIGPFYSSGPSSYISASEWQSSSLDGEEIKYLVTSSENLLLNDVSWSSWKNDLVNHGELNAIMGFRAGYLLQDIDDEYNYSDGFWLNLLDNLWSPYENMDSLWDDDHQPPPYLDKAIRIWMENACLMINGEDDKLLDNYACTVDYFNRYYIENLENVLKIELPDDSSIIKYKIYY